MRRTHRHFCYDSEELEGLLIPNSSFLIFFLSAIFRARDPRLFRTSNPQFSLRVSLSALGIGCGGPTDEQHYGGAAQVRVRHASTQASEAPTFDRQETT